jgi:hypothetical protein
MAWPELSVGDRIRAGTVGSSAIEGDVLEILGGTITVRTSEGFPIQEERISLAQLERMDVVRGKKRNTLKGLAWGGGIGTAFGLILGAGSGEAALYQFGLYGAFWGAIIGTFVKSDRWVPVNLGAIRTLPAAGGFAIRLSIR